MAALRSVGVVATLMGPEPEATRPPRTLAAAVVLPFVDFFKRGGRTGFFTTTALVMAPALVLVLLLPRDLGAPKEEPAPAEAPTPGTAVVAAGASRSGG